MSVNYTARALRQIAELQEEYQVVADSRCLARFINHDDHNPNCKFVYESDTGRLFISVLRRINNGEQLMVDYGQEFWRLNKTQKVKLS